MVETASDSTHVLASVALGELHRIYTSHDCYNSSLAQLVQVKV